MKRTTAVLITIILLFASACATDNNPIMSEEPGQETGTTKTESETTTEKPIITTTTTTTKKTTTTTPTTTAGIGTRKNPSQFGDMRTVSGTLYDGTYLEYTINLSNLRRGEEAKQIAISNNRYNEIPEGQEAIVFDVEFHLIDYAPEDDDSYWVSYYDFEYYTSNYTSFSGEILVGSNDEFGGSLYEGGTVTGDVILSIPEGDQGYILFDDTVWYALP